MGNYSVMATSATEKNGGVEQRYQQRITLT